MTDTPHDWRTTLITALPPGTTALTVCDGLERRWPVVAVLHQTTDHHDYGGRAERIVLGAFNLGNGEIEPVTTDDDEHDSPLGALVGVQWPEP